MSKLIDLETGRIWVVIGLYCAFLLTELIVGFKNAALVLIADAFHCLNDIITLGIALTATIYLKRQDAPATMPFGYQRAKVLGGFFNGVFLLGLSFSVFLQAIEQFIDIEPVEDPRMTLVVGGIGLVLNLTIPFIYDDDDHGHGHGHSHGHKREKNEKSATTVSDIPISEVVHDLEMNVSIVPHHVSSQSENKDTVTFRTRRFIRQKLIPKDISSQFVVQHALSDAINNVGVMVASLIMMYGRSKARFYADPAMSVLIAIGTAYYAQKVMRRSGMILLGAVPENTTAEQVEQTLKAVGGVKDAHKVVIWALSQTKCVVSAHVVAEPAEAEESNQIRAHTVDEEVGRVSEETSGKALLRRLEEALREALSPIEIHSMALQIEADGHCSDDATTEQASSNPCSDNATTDQTSFNPRSEGATMDQVSVV